MFTLQNWVLSAPPCHAELGHETDNLLHTITIASDLDSNWACKLDAEQPSYGICNVIDLVGDGGTLSADITADMFPAEGEWNLQVRAMKGDVVAHSTICTVRVGRSLNAIDFFPPMEPSEMAQMEARVTALKMQTEQAAANATDSAQDAQDAKTGAEAAQAAAEAARADAEHQSDLAAAWAVASQLARNEAQQAQTAAEDAQAAAETAKAGALAAESGAQASKEAAQAAQTAAETAAEGASTSKEAAQAAAQAAETAKEETLVAAGQVEDANQQAASSASQAQESRQAAQEHAEDALEYANAAKSWAVGGTGTRAGEDTDNAEYYSKNSSSMLTYAGIMAGVSNMWAEGGWGSDEFSYGPINPNGSQIINTAETLINGAEYQIEVQLPGYIQTYSYVYTDVLTIPGVLSMRQISGAVRISNLSSGTISGTVKRLSASLPEGSYDAKYWAQQAQEAGQGVSSFNNRTGAVTPQSGDYSADMIADLPIHKVVGTTDAPIDLLATRPDGLYLFGGVLTDRSEEFDEAFGTGAWAMIEGQMVPASIILVLNGEYQGQEIVQYCLLYCAGNLGWAASNGAIIENANYFIQTYAQIKATIQSLSNEKINSNEVTLLANGWVGTDAPYTQTVTAYVGPYENGLITMAKGATDEQYLAAAKAKIRVDSQPGSGNLTLKATGEKPSINIPVVVVGWNNTTGKDDDPNFYVMDGLPQDIGGGEAGVTSFAGRTGAVTPQSGDYTAAMVGALPTSGGTMTGPITMPESGAALTDGSLEVGKDSSGNLVIGLSSPLTVDVNGLTISQSGNVSLSSLQDPTENMDAANKRYVDNTAASILPSGGTEGQILTKTASGVAWQDAPASGGKRICRYVVGTSSAGWTAEDCDYLCDGTDDQVEINAALAAMPAGGGEVRLLDGTYHLSGAITAANGAVKLSGCGKSTILEPQLTSEAPHAFELSCPSFRLEQAAVHLTYVGAVSILLSAEVALFQGTSAVEEISLAGCEIDNLILYYVKAPATAKFTMEECSSLATSPPTTAQPASLCMCEYRDCFFAHRIFLHQADSAVVNCSFDVPSTMTEPVILLYASALILGNRLRAVNAIEGSTGGRSTVTGNRITLRDGGSLLKPRIGITCYSGDLVQGNTVLREEGAAAFRATEYTIQVSEHAAAAAVLGNILADKDVSDNGTSTVMANNVVLTTV